MDWFVKMFLKASLAWLMLGVTLGVAMAAQPMWTVYRTAHMHMLLLGFVTMMIYGVAYHVIPRFVGVPLFGRRAATWHWYAANAGLVLMTAGFAMRVTAVPGATAVLVAGGVLSSAGAYTFAFLLWRTLDTPPRAAQASKAAAPPPPTPLVRAR